MRLNELFEDTQYKTLYRGDATKIDIFDVEKTRNSIGLLFGHGIYLTDNREVAIDYSVKGGSRLGTVQVRDADSQEDAIRLYLNIVMVNDLGWIEHRDSIKADFVRTWQERHPLSTSPRPPGWGAEPSREYLDFQAEMEAYQGEIREKLRGEFSKYLKKAKALYRQRNPLVYRDTTGKWFVVMRDHSGTLTKFQVPEAYCRRALHGDRPLDDHELKVIRDFIYSVVPSGVLDLRDRNENHVENFDTWINVFRRDGTRYAWSDIYVGGRGQNPSLDEIWNGTYSASIFTSHIDAFIAHLRQHGFTGIEYDGGRRLGSHVRGGGGLRHQSYVFWDDDYINRCRVSADPVEYQDADLPLQKIRTRGMEKNWREPINGRIIQ